MNSSILLLNTSNNMLNNNKNNAGLIKFNASCKNGGRSSLINNKKESDYIHNKMYKKAMKIIKATEKLEKSDIGSKKMKSKKESLNNSIKK